MRKTLGRCFFLLLSSLRLVSQDISLLLSRPANGSLSTVKKSLALFFLLLLPGLLLPARPAAAQAQDRVYVLNGSAFQYSQTPECFQLTPDQNRQVGSVWYQNKLVLTENFDFEFELSFGTKDQDGADGIGFVLQPVSTGEGSQGEGMGYQGISPSVVVEYDTWQNVPFDPDFDHIAILRNGDHRHSTSNTLAGPVQASATNPNIEDGRFHTTRLVWDAFTLTLRVYFDGVLRASYSGDIVNTVFGGNPNVFWGFTSATGGANNVHRVCIKSTEFKEQLTAQVTVKHVTCQGSGDGEIQIKGFGGKPPYRYTIDGGRTFLDQTSFTNLAPGTYLVQIKDANNELSPLQIISVREAREPLTASSTQTAAGCFGTSEGALQVLPRGGEPPYRYSLQPEGGAAGPFQEEDTFTGLAPGTYTVRVTDAFGCTVATQRQISTKPRLQVAVTPEQPAICPGSPATLSAHLLSPAGVPAGAVTYTWSPASGLNATTGAAVTASPSATTTYTLTATYDGCHTSTSVTVTVQPEVTVQAGADQKICSGQTTRLGTAGTAGYTYRWAPATGLSDPTLPNPAFTTLNRGSQPDTLRYTLTATSNGCSRTDEVQVVVLPVPGAETISGSSSVCPGVRGVSYSINDPTSPTGYRWLIRGGTIMSGQGTAEVAVNWGPANANASLRAVGTTALGCPTDTVRLPVRVNPLLITPTPGGLTRLCAAQAKGVRYETSFTNGSVYEWQVIGGTIVSPDPRAAVIEVDWRTDVRQGKLVVTQISTTNLARCFGQSDTLFVNLLPSPDQTLRLEGSAAACENAQNLTFHLNGRPGSTYSWTLNGTRLPGSGSSVTISVAQAGTYTLTATETTAAGCAGLPIQKQITVHPLPTAQSISGPATVCPEMLHGHPFHLGGLPGSTYAWSVTGGTLRSGQGTDRVVVDFDGTADKAISVQETSAAGCPGPVVTLPVRFDAASLQLLVASTDERDEQQIVLQLAMPRNGANDSPLQVFRREAGQDWAKVGEIPNTATTYTDASADPDGKPYSYKIESTNACGTPLTTNAHQTIWLQATGNEQQQTVTLKWTHYRGWDGGVQAFQVLRKLDEEPEYSLFRTVPASDTTLTAVAAKDGFRQTYRIRAIPVGGGPLVSWSNDDGVSFENPLVFYNIFTPNGDGRNETFFIDNIRLYPGNELAVYNRWGKEVFRKRDYDNDWDGKELAEGVYYYQLTLPDRTLRKGWVEIVR